MSDEIRIEDLREAVNPVFNTAKSCLQLNAASGDEDAQRLLEALGFEAFGAEFDSKRIPRLVHEQVKKLFPAYKVLVEARFQMINKLIDSRSDMQVADLPCGYTSRGIRLYKQGRKYTGLDLPAVTDVLGPAVESIIGKNDHIRYVGVDATNYQSLEAALPVDSKNLLVTTEGLLMYFTQTELDEVFTNIYRLLRKYGGSWILLDRAYNGSDRNVAASALNRNPLLIAMYDAVTGKAASSAADISYAKNIYFDPDESKARDYVKKMGFDIKELCMTDYLPDVLGSLEGNAKTDAAVRDAYKSMFMWELTPIADAERTYHSEEQSFFADAAVEGGLLKLDIRGRVDTLTAPELLKVYQEAAASCSIEGIEFDLNGLEYISSAGLRVLLMMYKDLPGKKHFVLSNANEVVKEILATTGFDSAFGMDS